MTKKKPTTKGSVKLEITNDDLVHAFFPALTHVGNLSIKNVDVITKIVKAKRVAKPFREDYFETRKKILEQDCIRDENDKPVIESEEGNAERMSYKYDTPELEQEAVSRVNELLGKKVSFEVTPIKLAHLRNIEGVSANIIDSLDNFIEIE